MLSKPACDAVGAHDAVFGAVAAVGGRERVINVAAELRAVVRVNECRDRFKCVWHIVGLWQGGLGALKPADAVGLYVPNEHHRQRRVDRHSKLQFAVAQPFLSALPFGDVPNDADAVERPALGVSHHARRDRHPAGVAVCAHIPFIVLVGRYFAAQIGCEEFRVARQVVRVGNVRHGQRQQLFCGIPGNVAHRRVHFREAPVRVDVDNAGGRLVKRNAVQLLAVAKTLLGLFTLGDVLSGADKVDRLPFRVEQRLAARRYPTLPPIVDADDAKLGFEYAVPFRVQAPGHLSPDVVAIVRVYSGRKNLIVDYRVGRQSPHGFQPLVPLDRACPRIPFVRGKPRDSDCAL